MPVCSNCGGNDFVWADNLKTGTIGRGTLSLRTGGELAIGTRVCRGCGHADLFVKDPTILRQPHTWKPGEFLPMPPPPAVKPGTAASPQPAPPPAAPLPTPSPPPAPPTVFAPSPPTPPAPATPPAPRSEPAPSAPEGTPAASEAAPKSAVAREKKPVRRKSTKAKSESPSTVLEN